MTDLELFESLLKKHDWYFQFTDHHATWQRGMAEQREIQAMKKKLEESGVAPSVIQNLVEKYKPEIRW